MPNRDFPSRTPWLRRDQWDLFRKVFAGDDELPAGYDEWLRTCQDSVLQMSAAGFRVERVEIDVEELVTWCRRHRRPVDALAMMQFSGEVADRGSAPGDRPEPAAPKAMRLTEHRLRVGGSTFRISVHTPDDKN